jgi:stage III sporulation protein AA
MLGKLIRHGAFSRYIVLSRTNGVGTIQAIYDHSMNSLKKERVPCSN